MLLRRVIEHVREQNWTAIAIDFVIVVVGVFVGIQVANWNEERNERGRERLLLGELRSEVAESIRQTEIRRKAFEQVGRSGERAIAFLDHGQGCGDACWPVIVDFFHASQWQALNTELPTYEEMRRNGWPRTRAIVDAMNGYRRQALQVSRPLSQPPPYRAMVRGLIPLAMHRPYWDTCFQIAGGEAAYVEDLAPGVAPEIAAAGVAAIVTEPAIHRSLTEWIGFTAAVSTNLAIQNEAASRALALIDAELEAGP